jgi:hypothetical protein
VPLVEWALRSQKSILSHWLEPLRDRDVPWILWRGHMSLLDMVSNAHDCGAVESGLDPDFF